MPLFNAISDRLGGDFRVLLVRETHPLRRRWRVPWEEVKFGYEFLPGQSFDRFGQHRDLSVGTSRALRRLRPDAVVVAGWDLNASWAALAWCRRNGVPAVAWVESGQHTGKYRSAVSNAVRRSFLRQCERVLVPGVLALRFVDELVPGLPCVTMPNSIGSSGLRALPFPEPGRRALFIGELSERKGADVLLAGRHRVLRHFDRLTFAGTGPLEEEIRGLTRRDRRMEFLGFVEGDAMVDAMASSSAVLLPSRSDPWPLVPVEALVAGRPVLLGPGVGSAPDLEPVGDGVVTMGDLSLATLTDAAARLASAQVPASVRDRFRPEQRADEFVRAVEQAQEGG